MSEVRNLKFILTKVHKQFYKKYYHCYYYYY